MTCPDCDGRGRIRKRFLFFFKRWARCRMCLGTGVFPPPVVDRSAGRRLRLRDDDDDDTWAARGYGAGAIAGRDWTPRDADARAPDDRFEVGSGGRSGGGGATASWGDGGDNAPVIVDPFAAEAAVGGVIAAEAADAADAGSSSGSSSADDGDTASGGSDASSDGGTSY
jgi:hypothetical protein